MPDSTYDKLERQWLNTVGRQDDCSETFKVVVAVLMAAAEVRELRELLEQAALEARGQ